MLNKIMRPYFRSRFERYYLKNKWHLVLDLSLLITILILITTLIALVSFRPPVSDISAPNHQISDPLTPPIDINNPPLSLVSTVNKDIISRQEDVKLSITLKNDGSSDISDVALIFEPLDDNFSLSSLEKSNNDENFSIRGNKISGLEIKAESSKNIELIVNFKEKTASTRTVKWQAISEYILNSQPFKQSIQLPDLKLIADMSFNGGAYYTSPQGDQLGIGPLPPVVGLPTRYWVFWEVEGSDDLKDVVVSANLPRGVTLTDQRAVLNGELAYQPDNQKITWKIAQLKSADGPARLKFAVELVPSENQVGKSPILTEAGRYIAVDILVVKN
jgi:hypothetical protein